MSLISFNPLIAQSPVEPLPNFAFGTTEQAIWDPRVYTPMKANGNPCRTWRLVCSGDVIDFHGGEDLITFRLYPASTYDGFGPSGARIAEALIPSSIVDDDNSNYSWYAQVDIISFQSGGDFKLRGSGFFVGPKATIQFTTNTVSFSDRQNDLFLIPTMFGHVSSSANVTVNHIALQALN